MASWIARVLLGKRDDGEPPKRVRDPALDTVADRLETIEIKQDQVAGAADEIFEGIAALEAEYLNVTRAKKGSKGRR